jgi:hypothetical protein
VIDTRLNLQHSAVVVAAKAVMSSSSVSCAVVISNEDEEAPNLPVGVEVDDRVRTTSFTHISFTPFQEVDGATFQEVDECLWHGKHGIIADIKRETETNKKIRFFNLAINFPLVVILIIFLDSPDFLGWIFWVCCHFFFFNLLMSKVQQKLKERQVTISTEGVGITSRSTCEFRQFGVRTL